MAVRARAASPMRIGRGWNMSRFRQRLCQEMGRRTVDCIVLWRIVLGGSSSARREGVLFVPIWKHPHEGSTVT